MAAAKMGVTGRAAVGVRACGATRGALTHGRARGRARGNEGRGCVSAPGGMLQGADATPEEICTSTCRSVKLGSKKCSAAVRGRAGRVKTRAAPNGSAVVCATATATQRTTTLDKYRNIGERAICCSLEKDAAG